LIQSDTVDIWLLPGTVLKQLTAWDVICRWDVLYTYRQAISVNAACFLYAVEERMPFPVKAIQVDGGSKCELFFEEECQKRNTRLFVLPLNSPKLNGYMKRAHLTHTEEFYEVTDSSFHVPELSNNLPNWEEVSRYNRDISASRIFRIPYPSGVPRVLLSKSKKESDVSLRY